MNGLETPLTKWDNARSVSILLQQILCLTIFFANLTTKMLALGVSALPFAALCQSCLSKDIQCSVYLGSCHTKQYQALILSFTHTCMSI